MGHPHPEGLAPRAVPVRARIYRCGCGEATVTTGAGYTAEAVYRGRGPAPARRLMAARKHVMNVELEDG
jgi:hypothetical protein